MRNGYTTHTAHIVRLPDVLFCRFYPCDSLNGLLGNVSRREYGCTLIDFLVACRGGVRGKPWPAVASPAFCSLYVPWHLPRHATALPWYVPCTSPPYSMKSAPPHAAVVHRDPVLAPRYSIAILISHRKATPASRICNPWQGSSV